MALRALVTVGGVALPEPSEYNSTTATLVDSARNAEGVMIGSVIRDDVAKVEMTWRYLTASQWSAINKLFNRSFGGKFINSVTYFDQDRNEYTTKNMYVSDRTSGMFRRNPKNGDVMGWLGSRLALIEV